MKPAVNMVRMKLTGEYEQLNLPAYKTTDLVRPMNAEHYYVDEEAQDEPVYDGHELEWPFGPTPRSPEHHWSGDH